MVNLYILLTFIAALILTIVFVVLFTWEYKTQLSEFNTLAFPEWKHKNVTFDYVAGTAEEAISLTCPADKHMFINHATFQHYDPLTGAETSWAGDAHADSWWVSYGETDYAPGGGNGFIGQCDFKQSVAGFFNQSCLNAKGDCTVRVNKNGLVPWAQPVTDENAVCSATSACIIAGDCKFSVNVSYVCTSEEEVTRLVQFSENNV